MAISAKILADSVTQNGARITTMEVVAHRFVLAEVNTHRVFSRNWRSSRAVPVKKLLGEVRTNPAMPVHWGSNKPGMQAGEELSGETLDNIQNYWRRAAYQAAVYAENMMTAGLHKQVANRILEPFLYVPGVITSTEWDSFYALRCNPAAQPEMRVLAEAMREAQEASTPICMEPGDWHLPYITPEDSNAISVLCHKVRDYDQYLSLISAARCARVSYKLFDGTAPDPKKDLELAAQLMASGHWSPFEHQATPDTRDLTASFFYGSWQHKDEHRNFSDWRQHRAMIGG